MGFEYSDWVAVGIERLGLSNYTQGLELGA